LAQRTAGNGTPPVETSLVFKNNALLPTLYGDGDAHLTAIEKRFNVTAASRGNVLALSGRNAGDVEASRSILQELYNQLELGLDVGPAQVDAAIRMLGHEQVADKIVADTPSGASTVIKTAKKYIRPYSPKQAEYIQALHHHDLVFALGPAGTGKTYIAVAQAVAMFMNRQVERIILSRPAVEAGEKLGFLPGDLKEKVDPYLRPLYDALYEMLPAEKVVRFFETGEIEVAPLAFMRGRTLSRSYIILDESQNTTPTQMKMFLTRLGEGSRMVVTGDLSQVDLPRDVKSGLHDAVRKLEKIPDIATIRFNEVDVVRHPLAAKIVHAYDEWDRKKKINNGNNGDEK
jgi:phosphate starvation-inducible PhoH-like protein